jgi:hypothetical protein
VIFPTLKGSGTMMQIAELKLFGSQSTAAGTLPGLTGTGLAAIPTHDSLAPLATFQTIESAGNTQLVYDSNDRLYAQVVGNSGSQISLNGSPVQMNSFADWQPLAAETVAGANQMAWKNLPNNTMQFWTLDGTWNGQSSTGPWGLSSATVQSQEMNFLMDFNGDGVIGRVI